MNTWCLTCPEAITKIHDCFLQAGADIIETNTFGATSIVLAEYGLHEQTGAINQAAAQLARACAQRYSSPRRPRFVAGSMGPTTKTISVTGGVTFSQLRHAYAEQAEGLLRGWRRPAADGNGPGYTQPESRPSWGSTMRFGQSDTAYLWLSPSRLRPWARCWLDRG